MTSADNATGGDQQSGAGRPPDSPAVSKTVGPDIGTLPTVRVWAVVPAAGMGRRMGSAKQALPFRASTLAGTVVSTLLACGVAGVAVVTRRELVADLRLPADPRVEVTFNDHAVSEMIDSIRIGVAALVERNGLERGPRPAQSTPPPAVKAQHADDGVLVLPADMPLVTVDTCRRCIAAYARRSGQWVVAAYQGRRGHPLVLPLSAAANLNRNVPDGLRGALRNRGDVIAVPVDDPGVTRDVNTPDDYQALVPNGE